MTLKIATLFIFFVIFIPVNSTSSEMFDFGKDWQSLSKNEKQSYMMGFKNGTTQTISMITDEIATTQSRGNKIPKSLITKIRQIRISNDNAKIIEVISNLYNDPANSYIWYADMVLIANDSINGKDVKQSLLKARKVAVDLHTESLKK